jgi:TPR repeat protein
VKELAFAYLCGDGVEQNEAMAVKMFQRLSHSPSHPYGSYELGIAYELGRGVAQNILQARHYYQQAWQNHGRGGNAAPPYTFAYARLLLFASQSSRDDIEAFRLLNYLASLNASALNGQDNRSANVWAGWCYATGRGVTRDVDRALTYYQRARDDPRALNHILMLKADREARPVSPAPLPTIDPAVFHHLRGVGRGRWSVVNLMRSSNGPYYSDKELRTRDLDYKRELKLYESFNENDAAYVLVPIRADLDGETKKITIRYPHQSGGSLADVMLQYNEAKERIPEATLAGWYDTLLTGWTMIHHDDDDDDDDDDDAC